MHVFLANKLVAAYRSGLSENTAQSHDYLCEHFAIGLDSDAARNVDTVENMQLLVTLAYDMGKDSDTAGHDKATEMGTQLAQQTASMEITLDEWRKRYRAMKGVADTINKRRNDRARRLCGEAGLDENLLGIHPNNADASRYYGKPWPNIDYVKVDACLEELRHQFDADRIIKDWDGAVRLHEKEIKPI